MASDETKGCRGSVDEDAWVMNDRQGSAKSIRDQQGSCPTSSRHARQSPVEPARVRRLVVPDNLCETVVRVQLSRDWHWLTTYKCHANYSLAIRRGRDHHRRCDHRSHETLQTGVLAIVARFEWWAPERSETESSTLADRQCSNDHSFHIMLLPMFPFL